ncbi:7490_t:CDS:1, partial [Gigaspora rosea]
TFSTDMIELDNFFVLPPSCWEPENYIDYYIGKNESFNKGEVTRNYYLNLQKIFNDNNSSQEDRDCAKKNFGQ